MEMKLKVSRKMVNRLDAMAEKLNVSTDELVSRLLEIHNDDLLLLYRKKTALPEHLESVELHRVGIIGCEPIARGIAKLMALKGVNVVLIGESDQVLKKALELMNHNLDWMIEKWELTETEKKLIFQHIDISTHLEDLSRTDMVFDTYRCPPVMRRGLYRKLDGIIPEDIIIAIDVETCLVSRIAEVISRPERVIGFHFTYPASRRKIVEVMRGRKTDDKTYYRMLSVAKFLNKEVIQVVESAGAISTRIMIPFINEAIGLWIEGVATAYEIDRVMKLAMSLPMGPLEYADTLGLDVIIETMDSLWRLYGLPQFRPHARLRHLVRMGFLGKKTGRGIHSYETSQIGEAR